MKATDLVRRLVSRAAWRLRAKRVGSAVKGAGIGWAGGRYGYQMITVEYPPSASPGPRYGYGRPPHSGLKRILDGHRDRFASELRAFRTLQDDLRKLPSLPTGDPRDPHLKQNWFTGLDPIALYGYLRLRRPRRYLEVGSGYSTKFAARAKRDGDLDTVITSIDPQPRAEIDLLCDRIIREPLENVGASPFEELESGDVLLLDSSHYVFMNSDVTVFFLDVLPRLREGVLVGVHDVFFPNDYFPDWTSRNYSEQYLLAAYLLADCPWLLPRMACAYVDGDSELKAIVAPLWERPDMVDVPKLGLSFWFEIGPRG
jgi:hypothetical protein